MALWSCGISLHKLVAGVKCSAWMATDININVQHDSPLNHGINCGRRNEQAVSQPFLFWFGFSSSPLDMFPFFLLSFPSFLLFFSLFFVFLCLFLFYLFPFHHLFFFFKFLFCPFLLPFFLLIQFIFLLFLSFYLLFLLFLLFLLEWEKIKQKESMVTTSVVSNP